MVGLYNSNYNLAKSLWLMVALMLLTLTSCSYWRGVTPTDGLLGVSWPQHVDNMARMARWQMQGKISIVLDEPVEGFSKGSATLVWQQKNEDFTISVRGPLGIRLMDVRNYRNITEINIRGKEPIFSDNIQQQVLKGFGMSIPLSSLLFWVRGLPAPGVAEKEIRAGLLMALTQHNWHIKFSDYKVYNGYQLPSYIEFSHQGVTGRVVIAGWLPQLAQ